MNIVELLDSMPAVRLFVGSALTISFGLACRGYAFDRNAINMTRCFGTKNSRNHLVGLLTSSATYGI